MNFRISISWLQGGNMQHISDTLNKLNNITGLPFSLLDGSGRLLCSWPEVEEGTLLSSAGGEVIDQFRQLERDAEHPLIGFINPGFLFSVVEISPDQFILIGLVSPYRHTRAEVMEKIGESIHPAQLQQFCDQLLKQPLVSLEKLKDVIILLTRLLGNEIPPEKILFVDNASKKLDMKLLNQSLFEQREEVEYHVPLDFETAICSAVENGDRALLERSLFAPPSGRIGRMSVNELRQQKYSFICLATLVSRAAIRGGLDEETAFSLSDLYCQRADVLTEISHVENLTFTMLMDFCGKVREVSRRPASSPLIEKCLNYISVHLHEHIALEQLSQHCGICGRSLSIRFRKELGIGIPEYIHREKLREAEYLLRHTEYTLSGITAYLNYPSQSYFTQIFKKYRGMTPQQYRES